MSDQGLSVCRAENLMAVFLCNSFRKEGLKKAWYNYGLSFIVGSKNEVSADRFSVHYGTPVFRTNKRYEFLYNYLRKMGSAK